MRAATYGRISIALAVALMSTAGWSVEAVDLARVEPADATLVETVDSVDPAEAPCLTSYCPTVDGTRADVACASGREKRLQAIFAIPSDRHDRSATHVGSFREMLYDAGAFLHREARAVGGSTRLRMQCSDGEVTVAVERLSVASGAPLGDIVRDLARRGYNAHDRKYVVFFDGPGEDLGYRGVASGGKFDDRPSRSNRNNAGPAYAVVFGHIEPTWAIVLHEIGHVLGVVQPSAPHSDPNDPSHCTQMGDVMCSFASTSGGGCATLRFDCGNDDYFHPAPPPGSYLATHWNLGGSYVEFLDHVLNGPG